MTSKRREPDAQAKTVTDGSHGTDCGNGGNPSPLTSKERLRMEFPFTASCVAELRKAGFSIKSVKSNENGKTGEWGNG